MGEKDKIIALPHADADARRQLAERMRSLHITRLDEMPRIELDERSSQVMDYLSSHDSAGPTELVRAYGSSGATWSRTLAALAAQGLVTKVGQKYHLTGIGKTLV